jgi:hypothetical protein
MDFCHFSAQLFMLQSNPSGLLETHEHDRTERINQLNAFVDELNSCGKSAEKLSSLWERIQILTLSGLPK